MRSLNELLEQEGRVSLGRPPSECADSCEIMRSMVPKKLDDDTISAFLARFEFTVAALTAREHIKPGSIESSDKEDLDSRRKDIIFEGLTEDEQQQAIHCANEIMLGRCSLLDVVVDGKVGGVTYYRMSPNSTCSRSSPEEYFDSKLEHDVRRATDPDYGKVLPSDLRSKPEG